MGLFILTETPSGYALFKSKEKKLLKNDNYIGEINNAQGICDTLKLKQFQKFQNAATAVEEASAIIESKVSPMLARLLEPLQNEKKATLAVADSKLGTAINKLPNINISAVSDSTTTDLFRSIRGFLPSLIPGYEQKDADTMRLGLAHSLSRHKLKFSTEKVDTMIIQAIALLDDLDKELNIYAMRVKEWYGWHFPEMAKIINDNLAYARVILKMGYRSDAAESDLAEVLPEEIETAVKTAAEVSMGSEITEEDLENIRLLAGQVVDFTEYRQNLSQFLTNRMRAIAPNLTALVGDLVGARLISHSGSLVNLAKSPASTIQILGAEKALFRALKTKHDTPKYGHLYHASLVGQATGRNKGKIARMLATKTAMGIRVDSLSQWGTEGEGAIDVEPTEEEKSALGNESRIKIERRLQALEGKRINFNAGAAIAPSAGLGYASSAGQQAQPGKFELKEARKYNHQADGLDSESPAVVKKHEVRGTEKKKPLIEEVEEVEEMNGDEDQMDEDSEPPATAMNGAKEGSSEDVSSDEEPTSKFVKKESSEDVPMKGAPTPPQEKQKKKKRSKDHEAGGKDGKEGKKREKTAKQTARDKVAKEARKAEKQRKKAEKEAKRAKEMAEQAGQKRKRDDGAEAEADVVEKESKEKKRKKKKSGKEH
ncbi:MAG: Nucleolar protein 58 [Alyxoria varia]|nr:MAG: Nucleolar protein 58 [Alyxoria varia]